MPAENIIECEGLTMSFGSLKVLDGIDITVGAGENYGILGPNGSGKTTLIRILCGLVKPTSGSVKVFGREVPDRRNNRLIGYMTQMDALYNDLTVRENVRFFASVYGLKGHEREKRIDEVLDVVKLSERQESIVGTLSGGMKKRVSIACVLAHRPRLMFLDEPTVGVDPKLRNQFWDYFRDLNSQGVTLIVTTHIMDEAERCRRLSFLREGKKLIEGHPQYLKEQAGVPTLEEAYMYYSEGGSNGR
ncbi:heme ABC exporter ATP-binding protein CcmA [Methanocella sp. MCL-LM]|uniref:heme ABC exporter ATP-binding protein CcmA n=1 Tax=Methanocella sp. MCL-LM TaxID=3412035 RepID=UPI003C717762